jgi:hypothetical protein
VPLVSVGLVKLIVGYMVSFKKVTLLRFLLFKVSFAAINHVLEPSLEVSPVRFVPQVTEVFVKPLLVEYRQLLNPVPVSETV